MDLPGRRGPLAGSLPVAQGNQTAVAAPSRRPGAVLRAAVEVASLSQVAYRKERPSIGSEHTERTKISTWKQFRTFTPSKDGAEQLSVELPRPPLISIKQ